LGVSIATGLHLIPSRTQKLSPSAAILVPRKLGAKLARRPLLILGKAFGFAHSKREFADFQREAFTWKQVGAFFLTQLLLSRDKSE
jgi:hypothetical protein